MYGIAHAHSPNTNVQPMAFRWPFVFQFFRIARADVIPDAESRVAYNGAGNNNNLKAVENKIRRP